MKAHRLWLGLVAVLCVVGTAHAQAPCEPLRIDQIPWPAGHARYSANEDITEFSYAGGLYFLTICGSNDPSVPNQTSLFAVGRDLRNLHVVQLPARPSGRQPFYGVTLQTFFVRGWYYTAFDGSELIRSRNGQTWQRLASTGSWLIPPINWTGDQFVAVGELGDVWTSSDGGNWVYRTQVPDTDRPIWGPLADRSRLVVTGATDTGEMRGGYTEDYENWHLQDFPDPGSNSGATGPVIGNGWFFDGSKTRDGKTWLPVAEGNPNYGAPLDPAFFAGREIIGLRPETMTDPNDARIHLMTSPEGDAWTNRLAGTIPGKAGLVDMPQGGQQVWDGKRLWQLMLWFNKEAPRAHIEDYFLVSTSCADLGDPVVLPGVADTPGAMGSQWRTALSLHYAGPGAGEALVQWLPYGQENAEPKEVRLFFSTGESKEYENVLSDLFGATGVGSLRIVSVGPEVVVDGRTYDEMGAGRFGQGLGRWRWQDGIGKDDEGWLVGLADSGDDTGFRSNVAVQNLWSDDVEVEIVFIDASGKELLRKKKKLGAFEGYQWNRPLRDVAPVESVTAVVRVLSGDGRVAADASRVSNLSGDGWTIRAYKLPWQGTVP